MTGLFDDCFKIAVEMSKSAFSNAAVKGILSGFKTIGLPLIGIAILVLLIKKIIAIMDGGEVSFGDTVMRISIGAIVYQYGVTAMKWFYLLLLDTGKDVIEAITMTGDVKYNALAEINDLGSLFTVILLVIAIFYMMKSILSLLERFWMFLVSLVLLYLYLPGYIAGNDEGIIMWFKQCTAIALTQIMQTIILVLGMSLYLATGSIADFCLAIGAVIDASKIDQVLDKWGMSSGGKLGNLARNGMSSAFYARQMFMKK